MSEEINKADGGEPQKNVEEPQKKEHSDLENQDAETLVSIIKELRGEAASNRVAAKELQVKLDEIEAKENKSKEDDLKKKGEYEKLLSEKESRISELEKKANAFDEYYNSEVESIKTSLGDKWDDDFNKLSLSALKKLGQTMTNIKKVEVDDPIKNPKETKKIELTEEDKKEAEFMFPNFDAAEAHEAYKDLKIKKLELQKKKEK